MTEDANDLAKQVHALGPKAVVVTGGHRQQATDVFYDGTQLVEIPGERYPDGAAHGSGCTHASALAAFLARGDTPLRAAQQARRISADSVKNGLRELGRGPGPVDVLHITRRR
jgi:hydroxymethylpyrimidine/phosphomethylpyrimidine kinase